MAVKPKYACIEDYTYPGFPKGGTVEKGEVVTLEGWLPDRAPCIGLDLAKHQSHYMPKYLVVIRLHPGTLEKHFKRMEDNNTDGK